MNQVKFARQLAKLFSTKKLLSDTKSKLASIYTAVQLNNIDNKDIQFYLTQNGLRCGNITDLINRMPINWTGNIYFTESSDSFTIYLSQE